MTGFEPFNGAEINPTELAINSLKEELDNSLVRGVILPTSYRRSWELLKVEIDEFQPDVVLMFGLSQRANSFYFEKIAINYMQATISDNDGLKLNGELINRTGPDGIFATINIEQYRNSCGGEQSLSAGSYVCNSLFYNCLNYLDNRDIKSGFIHVPASTDVDAQSKFSQEDINSFVKKVINFAIHK